MLFLLLQTILRKYFSKVLSLKTFMDFSPKASLLFNLVTLNSNSLSQNGSAKIGLILCEQNIIPNKNQAIRD